jgi:UTP--glucose-1-phosphate uridylyltransferase
MTQPVADFAPFDALMRREGLPEIAIRTFAQYYAQLAAGQTGLLPEADLEPATGIPDAEALPASLAAAGRRALPHTVMLKLNGGLGTGMGLERAKSLLTVKDGLTFLEIIAHQARAADVPLLLMNSFSTRADSLALLAGQSLPDRGLPADFLQHKVPKVRADDLRPAQWPVDPDLAWCPPGHGDLYTALVTSGVLDCLLARGFRWAFVSNADNLGATIDPVILGHVVASGAPLVMEVADRTAADRKGGHLARRRDGRLILREVAQCPPADEECFPGHRTPPLLQYQHAVAGPAGAGRSVAPRRRHHAPADDPQPQDPRSARSRFACGVSAGDGDGRGHRDVRRRRRPARAPGAVRTHQAHQ